MLNTTVKPCLFNSHFWTFLRTVFFYIYVSHIIYIICLINISTYFLLLEDIYYHYVIIINNGKNNDYTSFPSSLRTNNFTKVINLFLKVGTLKTVFCHQLFNKIKDVSSLEIYISEKTYFFLFYLLKSFSIYNQS